MNKKQHKLKKPKKSSGGFIEKALLPIFGKMGQQRHLSSIRDAFATITPLIIAGALSILIMTAVFGGEGSAKVSLLGQIANWSGGVHVATAGDVSANKELYLGEWILEDRWATASTILGQPFGLIQGATFGLIGVWFTFMFGYYLSKTRDFDNPITAGMVSLAAFMIVTQADNAFFGSAGSLIGIFIGLAATELYIWISKIKKLEIKMPSGVPPAVGRSFQKLLPIIITLVIIATADTVIFWLPAFLHNWGYHSSVGDFGFKSTDSSQIHFAAILYYAVIAPFLSFAGDNSGGLSLGLLYVTLITFIWFFGLHGANVLDGIFGTIFLTLAIDNADNISGILAGTYSAAIVTNPMLYSFVILGGAGSTLGLLISLLIFSKTEEKKTAKFSIAAGAFQINEPVLFGLPIVLNGIYFIPFVFVHPILLIVSWLAIRFGMVQTPYIQIPWTTPPILAGLISTGFDWKSIILSVINIAISIGVYTPFVLLSNKTTKKSREEKTRKEDIVILETN